MGHKEGYTMKNALYTYSGMAKGTSWAEVTLSNENSNLCHDSLKASVWQLVSRKFLLIKFLKKF